jgi:hypothetical protein
MTAAPATENPTLKKGCEETHLSFFTAPFFDEDDVYGVFRNCATAFRTCNFTWKEPSQCHLDSQLANSSLLFKKDRFKQEYSQFSGLRSKIPIFEKGKQTVWGDCLLKGI